MGLNPSYILKSFLLYRIIRFAVFSDKSELENHYKYHHRNDPKNRHRKKQIFRIVEVLLDPQECSELKNILFPVWHAFCTFAWLKPVNETIWPQSKWTSVKIHQTLLGLLNYIYCWYNFEGSLTLVYLAICAENTEFVLICRKIKLLQGLFIFWTKIRLSTIFKGGNNSKKHGASHFMKHIISPNGILFPKLFWPTVRKIVLVTKKNFWNLRLKTENFQKFWDQ